MLYELSLSTFLVTYVKHLKKGKDILCYLKGVIDRDLWILFQNSFLLSDFYDVD